MSADEQAVRAVLGSRDDAIGAGDAERAVASIAEGSVNFDLAPPLAQIHAPAPVIAGLRDWFATWDGPVTSRLDDPTVLVSGDLAVAHGLAHMQGVKTGDGPLALWFRQTVVLERRGGRWTIVHEHSSVPMAMDGSGRALTDLMPN